MPTVKVGKYKLVRRLASGGMGEVWEGALEGSQGFARRVAIKRMMGVEDVPLIFLSQFNTEVAVQPWVKGLVLHGFWPPARLENCWLER